MDSSAEMTCVLKVNVNCDACKRKVMEVLQNLRGVYSVVIDAEQGTVKVCGKVTPNVILKVFEKYEKHGEVSYIQFEGEVNRENRRYDYGEQGYYNPYGAANYPYPLVAAPQNPWYENRGQFLQPPPPPPPPPPPLTYSYFPPVPPKMPGSPPDHPLECCIIM